MFATVPNIIIVDHCIGGHCHSSSIIKELKSQRLPRSTSTRPLSPWSCHGLCQDHGRCTLACTLVCTFWSDSCNKDENPEAAVSAWLLWSFRLFRNLLESNHGAFHSHCHLHPQLVLLEGKFLVCYPTRWTRSSALISQQKNIAQLSSSNFSDYPFSFLGKA